MGMYINPEGEATKEEWLFVHGLRCKQTPTWPAPEGKVLVCLVDNGFFRAAGVAYSKREYEAFLHPDPRDKSWWITDIDSLKSCQSGLDEDDIKTLLGD